MKRQKPDPLKVECPHCWASIGERCYPTTGPRYKHTPKPHAIRRAAVARLGAGQMTAPRPPEAIDPVAFYVDLHRTRADMARSYAYLLTHQAGVDWTAINMEIINRWSRYGLQWIKARAWDMSYPDRIRAAEPSLGGKERK